MEESNKDNTVQFGRTRKVNLELIDQKFKYMSEEVSASLWLKVAQGETAEEEVEFIHGSFNEIEAIVNERLDQQVQKIVEHYQKVAKAKPIYREAAEQAFMDTMKDFEITVPDGRTVEEIQSHFLTLLERISASYQV